VYSDDFVSEPSERQQTPPEIPETNVDIYADLVGDLEDILSPEDSVGASPEQPASLEVSPYVPTADVVL
jgi:hypothetical protein